MEYVRAEDAYRQLPILPINPTSALLHPTLKPPESFLCTDIEVVGTFCVRERALPAAATPQERSAVGMSLVVAEIPFPTGVLGRFRAVQCQGSSICPSTPLLLGRPENCFAGGDGMGARRRRGGGVPEMGFRARPFVLCKDGCCRQRRRNTNFGPEKCFSRKNVPPHMCSQNDQRDVGIILSHICWGWTPPPPRHGR